MKLVVMTEDLTYTRSGDGRQIGGSHFQVNLRLAPSHFVRVYPANFIKQNRIRNSRSFYSLSVL